MAVGTPSALTSGTDSNVVSSYATASITPTGGRVVIVVVLSEWVTNPNTPTLSGNGITWNSIISKGYVSSASPTHRITAFWGTHASPSTGTITIDFASQTQVGASWSVFEFPDAHTTTPIIQTPTPTFSDTGVETLSITMAAYASGSAGLVVFGSGNDVSVTPRTNWTEIHDVINSTREFTLETQYRLADDDGSATWSGNVACAMLGIEIGQASGATLTASAGSFTITGTAATLTSGRRLAADPGSVAITGTAATLKAGRIFGVDAGSYAITGTAAGLFIGRAIAGGVGSFAITGTAASLLVGRKITASGGSYLITGTDASFSIAGGGAFSFVADPGAFTITGTAAALKAGRLVTASAGSYLLTGTAANLLSQRKVTATNGTYLLAGTNATLQSTRLLAASAGVYTLIGTAVTLLFSPVSTGITPRPMNVKAQPTWAITVLDSVPPH